MEIPVSVAFLGFEGSPELEDFIRGEAAKLERYFSPIISCRVFVGKPQKAVPEGAFYHVRIEVGVAQANLVVNHEPSLHPVLQDMKVPRSHAEARVTRAHKQPQRAIREAFGEMRRQLQDHARKLRAEVKRKQQPMLEGRITKLFPDGDYGFLETLDGREVYFARNSVLQGHYERLRPGTEVLFAEEPGERGPQASTLRILRPRQQAREAARSVVARKPVRKARAAAAAAGALVIP